MNKDYKSLKKKADVLCHHYKPEKNLFKFIYQLILLHIFIIRNIRSSDILYSWFADYHSFPVVILGKLFRKDTVIIVGGNDAVSVPEIKYGVFYKKGFRQFCVKQTYKMASLILPVHKSLIEGVNYYADKNGLGTGVKYFVKDIKASVIEVPTGYDSEIWRFDADLTKEKSVVTTAGVKNMRSFILKGLPLFIEVAKALNEYTFIIIGVSSELKKIIEADLPENLVIYDYIPNDQLVKYISKSKVYCQFSLSEGLPNALCEAMLCECIPVGSSANGIPDGMGDAGYVLKERDVSQAVSLVKQALESKGELGKKAREHIINQYSHQRRENTLFDLLKLN